MDPGRVSFASYTLVTRETNDQDFAMHRQLFLAEQGYAYEIRDEREVLAEGHGSVQIIPVRRH